MSSDHLPPLPPRQMLRQRLRADRERFAASLQADAARGALGQHLVALLDALEPESLGLYWPVRSEFNAAPALRDDARSSRIPWALPFTQRVPPQMHYRLWDRAAPTIVDECRIPACEGAPLVPDVVLVPCVGFTRTGYRLGYGGGFFDRWLAANPQATAVGIAWSLAEITEDQLQPESHDLPLAMVVTELGVVAE